MNRASILMSATHILVARQHLGENSDIFPANHGPSASWRAHTLAECAALAVQLSAAVDIACDNAADEVIR